MGSGNGRAKLLAVDGRWQLLRVDQLLVIQSAARHFGPDIKIEVIVANRRALDSHFDACALVLTRVSDFGSGLLLYRPFGAW